jgi:hypothetical protein
MYPFAPSISSSSAAATASRVSGHSFFTEQLPPSYEEERNHCFNLVLGLSKVQPLVELPRDPVTTEWCEKSHDTIRQQWELAIRDAKRSARLSQAVRFRWYDLELASTRGVCIDRYHFTASFKTPIWLPVTDLLYELERNDANRNIPALLLRRIMRAELTQAAARIALARHHAADATTTTATARPAYASRLLEQMAEHYYHPSLGQDDRDQAELLEYAKLALRPQILDQYFSLCPLNERSLAELGSSSSVVPFVDNAFPLDRFLVDLNYLLAPFTETMAYLFDGQAAGSAGQGELAILRVLSGDKPTIFERWHIPPPRHEPRLIKALVQGNLNVLQNDFQLYTTVLWRLAKAHTLMHAITSILPTADRMHVFHVPYSYAVLKCLEYRVQLYIDTHVKLYAWACGDGVWSDSDWLAGPGGQLITDEFRKDQPPHFILPLGTLAPCVDVGSHSPIVRFYPDCRSVLPSETELPDLALAIGEANLTTDVNVKPSNPTQEQALLHFLCKFAPNRCQIRNFIEIVMRYMHGREPKEGKPPFLGFPSLKEYILLVIRCGLLGNYRFATERPDFAGRVEIEYAFIDTLRVPNKEGDSMGIDDLERLGQHARLVETMENNDDGVGDHPTRISYRRLMDWDRDDSLSRWIKNNATLCFHIFKEHYVYTFMGCRALDIVMSRFGQMGRYKNLMLMRMDFARSFMRKEGGYDMAVAAQDWRDPLNASAERYERYRRMMLALDPIFEKFHRADKKTFIKLYKGHWPRVLLRHMNMAITYNATGHLPSGYRRVAMPGDDDPELFAQNGYRLTSTADMLSSVEIARGEALKRSRINASLARRAGTAEAGSMESLPPGSRDLAKSRAGGKGRAGASSTTAGATGEKGKAKGKGKGKKKGGGGGGGGSDDEDEDDEEDEDDDDDEDEEEEEEEEEQEEEQDGLDERPGDEEGTTRPGSGSKTAGGGSTTTPAAPSGQSPAAADTYAMNYTMAALANQLREAMKQVTDIDFDLMDCVSRDVMRRRQSTWFVETRWLVDLFGVSMPTLRRFQSIYAYYESYDMPDHQLLERMFSVLQRDRRDFYVIRLWCYFCMWHSQQKLIPLTLETRHAQIYAMRHKWNLAEDQDMPQDLEWGWFCPGSRRWFSAEATAPRHKIDTIRDRQRHLRDMAIDQDRDTQFMRLKKAQAGMKHLEKESELVFSINMEHAAFNDDRQLLYARRKTAPNLRRLYTIANLVYRPDTQIHAHDSKGVAGAIGKTVLSKMSDQELVEKMALEIDLALAEMADSVGTLAVPATSTGPAANMDATVSPLKRKATTTALEPAAKKARFSEGAGEAILGSERPLARGQDEEGEEEEDDDVLRAMVVKPDEVVRENKMIRLFSTEDLTFVATELPAPPQYIEAPDPTVVTHFPKTVRRQTAWFTDEARKVYRSSSEVIQSRYDSGSRSPLVPISMIGRVAIMNDKAYVSCVVCLVLTPLESSKLTNDGPTCGLHDRHALFKQNRRFLMIHGRALPERPSLSLRRALHLEPEEEGEEEEDEAKEESVHQADQEKKEATAGERKHCHFCDHFSPMTGRDAHRLTEYEVVHETSGLRELLTICRRDERMAWASLHGTAAGGFPSYERIARAIAAKRMEKLSGLRAKRIVPRILSGRASGAAMAADTVRNGTVLSGLIDWEHASWTGIYSQTVLPDH